MVKEAIIRKAKRVWLIASVLRVLRVRHSTGARCVAELLINRTDGFGDWEKLR